MAKQFQIKPVILWFDNFDQFIEEVNCGPTDCIFTVRFLYEQWLKPRNLSSNVLCYEDYGQGEPTDDMIDRILADFTRLPCQRVIAIGGGSVLDVAKLLALQAPRSALALFLAEEQPVKAKTLLLVPTTCGTGSEMTCISIAGIPSKHTKKGLAHPALFADTAALVPELLHALPRRVLITSSLDAMTHAMESFVSPKAHAYSELFSREAIRLLLQAYQRLQNTDDDNLIPQVAGDLLRASNYAGIAFGNTGVGAVHALAYPLGEQFHVFHGEACARFFSAVFKAYRQKKPTGKILSLTQLLAQSLHCATHQDPWQRLDSLLECLLSNKSLRDYGMLESDIETFTDSVIREQQRLLVNNYVELSRTDIRNIYRELW